MVVFMLEKFIAKHQLPQKFTVTATSFYQPIAERIFAEFTHYGSPYFVGVNGCQGSGKSTFTEFIAEYLTINHHLKVAVLSLDDFYLSSKARQNLAMTIHPLLATRGVPGTHDTTLLQKTLADLKAQKTDLLLPRFNKATDNPSPQSQWSHITKSVDVILFEGWCWGVPAQTTHELANPINMLETQDDPQSIWRQYVNTQLSQHYQPLYSMMKYWLTLQAPSFDCVYQWRLEQEQKLANKTKNIEQSAIMSPTEVNNFIQYFQRLTEYSMQTLSITADVALRLDVNRKITQMIIKEE